MKCKTICNMCGNEFNELDEQEGRCIHDRFGYGSVHDGDNIELDLCIDCFDKVINIIRPMCKHDFIEEI